MSVHVNDITGFVMAGGESRRFGRDKRLLEIDGSSLLDRSRRLLFEFLGEEPFLVGDNLDAINTGAARIIRDAKPGCGPAGGLVSVLKTSPTPWALVLAVDLPNLGIPDLERLAAHTPFGFDVITLSLSGNPEPLAALYHRQTAGFWTERLEHGELELVDGIRKLSWKPVIVPQGTRTLDNINSPLDLHRANGD